MPTQFTSEGLQLSDGSTVPVYAGEFHYWRSERKSWRPALEALKELGLTMVSTVVPWSVHETRLGQYDFTNSLDLGAFLDEVHDLGLYALVRPGPHCNAQLTQFGFPERILADPEIQALGGRGTPLWLPAPPKMFPVPSYASSKFQTEVRAWYARVAEVLVPRANPTGSVVALQVDHEMQMFWRMAAFEGDYHPEALTWWDEFAGGQDPPRKYRDDDMPRVLLWQTFKEEYIRKSLTWLGKALDEVGLDSLARYHNLPPCDPTHCNLPMVEASTGGVAGMDFYDLSSGYSRVRKRAIYLAGTSKLPLAPELSVGGPPWFPTMTEQDEKNVALGALAGGIRGFNFYMAIERERWYGGILDQNARTTESADWIAPLLQSLRDISFPTLRRQTPIALVMSRAEARAAVASQAVHSASHAATEWLGLGPEGHAALALDPDSRLYPRWLAAIIRALDLAELPYQLVDEQSLHRIGTETKAVLLPTLRRVDGAAWAGLHALAGTGIQVIIGPEVPREDELGRPLGADAVSPEGAGMISSEMLEDPEAFAASLLDLAGDLGDLWIAPESPGVDCSIYSDPDGVARALFVGNSSKEATTTRVNVPESCVLRDAISGEKIAEVDGMSSISLASNEVRFFLLQP
jgi:beta-galactosidase